MGRELYAAFPVYRGSLDRICVCFEDALGVSLREVIFEAGNARRLEQTQYAQAALFAVEVSLVRLLESWGIRADVVMGHSVGELGAAHVAGVLSLEDACRLVAARGRLMQGVSAKGAMASLQATEAEVEERLGGRAGVSIAAVNGPRATVISGDEAAVQEVMAEFEGAGRKAKRLEVSHAFHSSHMDEVLEAFGREVAKVDYSRPQIPVISNVTGKRASDDELRSAGYWVRHVRETVRFGEGVQALEAEGVTRYVEVGPRGVLSALAAENLTERGAEESVLLAALRADRSEVETVLEVLCNLHVIGQSVDWGAFFEPLGARRMALPTYAFQHERYWLDAPKAATGDMASVGLAAAEHPFLGAEVALAEGDGLVLTGALSLESQSWLREHDVFGTVILPGTAFLELAFAAGERVGLERVEELVLEAPLGIREKARVQMQVVIGSLEEQGGRPLSIYARESGAEGEVGWIRHASGRLGPSAPPATQEQSIWDYAAWPPAGARAIPLDELYERLSNAGLVYGPSFQGLHAAWKRGEDLFVEVQLPERMAEEAGQYHLHPALLDSVLHALALNIEEPRDNDGRSQGAPGKGVVDAWEPALPFSWTGATLPLASSSRLRAQLSRKPDGGIAMTLGDASGRRVAQVQTLLTRPVSRDRWLLPSSASSSSQESMYVVNWIPCRPSDIGSPTRTHAQHWALLGDDDGPWTEALEATVGRLDRYPDLASLCAALADGATMPERVVCPWMASATSNTDPLPMIHDTARRALSFLQAWIAEEPLANTHLVLLTHRAMASGSDETWVDLPNAPLWGLARSVQSEHPELRMTLADFDGTDASIRALSNALPFGEPQIAARSGALHIPRFARAMSRANAIPARLSGTYLITGGTGGLGGEVAELVVKRGVGRVILLSRQGESAPGAKELKARLEKAGAEVRVEACDVGERAQLEEVLKEIEGEWGLDGVIHTAGVLEDGVVEKQTEESLVRVMRGKVDGAWHLHELTRGMRLEAFVMFSSVSGLVGGAGQSNYAAANAFLDALAHHRRSQGLSGQSLAWGRWTVGKGMGSQLSEGAEERMERWGVGGLGREEGLELFEEALGREEALLVPAKLQVREVRRRAKEGERIEPLLRGLMPEWRERGEGEGFAERVRGMGEEERGKYVMEVVREEVGRVLGRVSGGIEETRPLQELGLDSLMAVELRNRLGAVTGRRLPATLLFDHPTPRALAQRVLTEIAPPEAAPIAPVLTDIDKLEGSLARMDSDERTRAIVAARLRRLLSKWARVETAADGSDIDGATNDELFRLLDQELDAMEASR
ncbi:type I polyketide synthase [Pendulispora albinea]|uniref:Type I polyketide synthase n=2 Tax=Pendulispora albinea TaxID=2741071 RepID=A0ABZ2MCY3_9BACT